MLESLVWPWVVLLVCSVVILVSAAAVLLVLVFVGFLDTGTPETRQIFQHHNEYQPQVENKQIEAPEGDFSPISEDLEDLLAFMFGAALTMFGVSFILALFRGMSGPS